MVIEVSRYYSNSEDAIRYLCNRCPLEHGWLSAESPRGECCEHMLGIIWGENQDIIRLHRGKPYCTIKVAAIRQRQEMNREHPRRMVPVEQLRLDV